MVAALAAKLGTPLASRRVWLLDGAWIEVDGASDDLSVLCEAWAHQGPAKAAQQHKILKDALKLALATLVLGTAPRLILVFSDEGATSKFRTGWAGLALREFGIEIEVVEISESLRQRVRKAQARQYR